MGNYIIIGGDGREYGPISESELRQWFAEGRLNGGTLVKAVSDAEFRPLAIFPEFASLLTASTAQPNAPWSSAALTDDYQLDLAHCVSSGWDLTRRHFGLLFMALLTLWATKLALGSLVNVILISALAKIFSSPAATVSLGFLLVVLNAPVIGPLMGGVCLVCLRVGRGQPAGLGEVFTGFKTSWVNLFWVALVVETLTALCAAPASYVSAVKINPIVQQLQTLQTQNAGPDAFTHLMSQMLSAYGSNLPVLLACLVPVTYVTVCWQFALPLVIDKHLSVGSALKLSWQRVHQHWWQVFGLTILAGLVSLSGVLGCGVGVVLTLPIGLAISMRGYETIFSSKAG